MAYFSNLKKFIDDLNKHAYMENPVVDEAFFDNFELDMARAFILDSPDVSVKVSKIILALKNIGDIRVKIE